MKKFDIAMIAAGAAVLIMAFLFYPAKKINFGSTTLVFSQWFDSEDERAVIDDIIAEFEDSHPGINIIPVYRTYQSIRNDFAYYSGVTRNEQAFDKKNKRNDARELPDIVSIDPLWFDDSEEQILFANQNISEASSIGVNNDVFSIPLYSYFNMLFYNIKILEDAGFDRPPKTRGEFMSVCIKLKEKNIYGLSVSDNFFTDIFPWILSETGSNVQIFNSEEDNFDFSEKNVIESINFFNEINAQNMLGRPPFIGNEEEKINNFLAGKTAMMTASSRLIKLFEAEYSNLNFGVTNIPYSENYSGRPVFNMSSVHAAVLSASPHKEEALEFVKFLNDKKAALAAAAGAVSEDTASSVFAYSRAADMESGSPVFAKAQNMIESAETVDDWKLFSARAALNSIAGEEIIAMLKYNRGTDETAAAIKNRYAYIVE
ncbi:MAG: extracellular solute-binding protein [Spirochaetaceae bacterium]|jgi:multiple sugar transport system substrate-binding protein|nr:extracellular solute-binding protein [Spirochaetaceae bacterium]